MHALYQTYASGDLRTNPSAAFAMSDKAPVVIMSRATPHAVMVSPEMWDATARRLAYLESLLEDDAASRRIQAGEYDTVDTVDAMMATP